MRRLNKGHNKEKGHVEEDYWGNFPKEVKEVLEDDYDQY